MPYEQVGENKYSLTGAVSFWAEEIKELFGHVTADLAGDKQAQWSAFTTLMALSMGRKAKLKWEKGWFSKRKAKAVGHLLAKLEEDEVSTIVVFDFLAENMLLEEMRAMKADVAKQVGKFLRDNADRFLPPELRTATASAPASNTDGMKLVTFPKSILHYPAGRYPARWWGTFSNAIGIRLQMSDEPVEFLASLFISYSHADKEFARRLARDLRRSRVKVWLDEAEMVGGEPLRSRIEAAIREADCLGIILSPASVASDWVRFELNLAMRLGEGTDEVRILPILYQPCARPELLSDRLVVDFTDPNQYRLSLEAIVNSLLGLPPPKALTAKEAARLVKVACNPPGGLCGISQQGLCQLVESQEISLRGDRHYADAKTGRSTVWILEYFCDHAQTIYTYTVNDGRADRLRPGTFEGEIKVVDFNYVDSDVAVAAALERAGAARAIPPDEDSFFVETMLKYCAPIDGHLWFVVFFDVTLSDVTFVVEIDPHDGSVVGSYRPSEVQV